MPRLIDANELKMSVILPRCGAKTIIGDAICKMIDSAPTVDAVPVIRCKDCRWYWKRMRVCTLKEHKVACVCAVLCMEDDFCSRAELKVTE